MKSLFPERIAELGLDEEAQQETKQQLDILCQGKNWWSISEQAVRTKTLWPEKTAELGLDEEAWQGMKRELEILRQKEEWEEFFKQVMEMKILAAKEVKITDRGIECVMPSKESFRESKPERPVRRKF